MSKAIRLPFIGLWIILIHLFISTVLAQAGNTNTAPAATPIIEQYYQWVELGKSAVPELKEAIKNNNWRVRTHALLAMGKTGDQSLTPLILDRLENDANSAVKNCAVTALGDLKATSAVPPLLGLLEQTQKNTLTR